MTGRESVQLGGAIHYDQCLYTVVPLHATASVFTSTPVKQKTLSRSSPGQGGRNSEGSTHLAEGGEAALLEGQQLGVCVPLQPVPAALGPRHHHHLATCTQPDITFTYHYYKYIYLYYSHPWCCATRGR